jgi:hypothetical protein
MLGAVRGVHFDFGFAVKEIHKSPTDAYDLYPMVHLKGVPKVLARI